MRIHQVNPSYVCQIWPSVEGFLSSALMTGGGEYNVDQLKGFLTDGRQCLLVADDDGEIKGACAISFNSYPNEYIAFVTAIGGRMIANKDLFSQLCEWAKSQGATKIRGAAFESVERLWRQKFGFEERYRIVEKSL